LTPQSTLFISDPRKKTGTDDLDSNNIVESIGTDDVIEVGVDNPLGNTPLDEIDIEILDEASEGGSDGPEDQVVFRDQTLDTDVMEIASISPRKEFFYPLTKSQCKAAAKVFKIVCDTSELPKIVGKGKLLGAHAPVVFFGASQDGHCYFHAISYLLTGKEYYHFQLRHQICDYIENPINYHKIRAYLPPTVLSKEKGVQVKIDNGNEYVKHTKMRLNTWATEVEIYATAQIISKDIVVYARNSWIRHVASGYAVGITKHALYLNNQTGNHFDPVTRY
jgi:hypothetical protein